MLKGFIILLGVGVAFAYFVFNFVGDVERSDPDSFVSKDERKQKEWAKYYTKDALENPVLDLKKAPMKLAKEIWAESQLRQEMLSNFPDFELVRNFVNERLRPSPFRDYLLKKIDEIETDYQAGTIDSETARKRLESI